MYKFKVYFELFGKNMYKFKVYFEIFGKKMKTEVYANNPTHAEEKVLERLKIIKVEKIDDIGIMDFLNMIKKYI